MENVIIFLLVVYFFLIRPVLKHLREAGGGRERKRRSPLYPLLEKLQQKIREAAAQARTPARGQGRSIPSWRDFFPQLEEVSGSPSVEPTRDAGSLTGWREEPWFAGEPALDVSSSGTRAPTKPQPMPRDARSEAERTAQGPPVSAIVLRPSGISLRQAVIWSEILGPPLALRDRERGK